MILATRICITSVTVRVRLCEIGPRNRTQKPARDTTPLFNRESSDLCCISDSALCSVVNCVVTVSYHHGRQRGQFERAEKAQLEISNLKGLMENLRLAKTLAEEETEEVKLQHEQREKETIRQQQLQQSGIWVIPCEIIKVQIVDVTDSNALFRVCFL